MKNNAILTHSFRTQCHGQNVDSTSGLMGYVTATIVSYGQGMLSENKCLKYNLSNVNIQWNLQHSELGNYFKWIHFKYLFEMQNAIFHFVF